MNIVIPEIKDKAIKEATSCKEAAVPMSHTIEG